MRWGLTFVLLAVLLVPEAQAASKEPWYFLRVQGFPGVVPPENGVLVLRRALLKESGARGERSLHLRMAVNRDDQWSDVVSVNLFGIRCSGTAIEAPDCRWSSGEGVHYEDFGLLAWDRLPVGKQVRISLAEDQSRSAFFEKVVKVNSLRSGREIQVEGRSATLWFRTETGTSDSRPGTLLTGPGRGAMAGEPDGFHYLDPPRALRDDAPDRILVGFRITAQDGINSIQPLFQELSASGTLRGKLIPGDLHGIPRGAPRKETRQGYVVAGLNVRVNRKIQNLEVVYRRWLGGWRLGGHATSRKYGRDVLSSGTEMFLRPGKNHVVTGIYGYSDETVSAIGVISAEAPKEKR